MRSTLFTTSVLATLALAKDIAVKVGPGLTYSPNSIKADLGDTVTFTFEGSTHDVTQGAFDSPCQNNGGFFSGTISGTGSEKFVINITTTDPVWFYCSVPSHCQSGMVGVINQAASGDKTLAKYKSAAAQASSSNQPDTTSTVIAGSSSSSASASGGSSTASATGSSTVSGSSTSSGTGAAANTSNAASGLRTFGDAGFLGVVAAMLGWAVL